MYRRLTLCFAVLIIARMAVASSVVPAAVSAAVDDPNRPVEQKMLDPQRKPASVIAFAGIKEGQQVADFMPGNAYFTRIFSKLVGPHGRVYAFIPAEQIKNCEPSEIAGSRAIEHDPAYRNVVQLSAPVDHFSLKRQVDVLWTAQNYHDLHDAFLGPADIKVVDRNFYNALKPGGVLLIIDHAASPGSGLRDTERLHRIDPSTVRSELEDAGFVFEGQIGDLGNPNDDHSQSVFDPAIKGNTDQFVYKFRKPTATN